MKSQCTNGGGDAVGVESFVNQNANVINRTEVPAPRQTCNLVIVVNVIT